MENVLGFTGEVNVQGEAVKNMELLKSKIGARDHAQVLSCALAVLDSCFDGNTVTKNDIIETMKKENKP